MLFDFGMLTGGAVGDTRHAKDVSFYGFNGYFDPLLKKTGLWSKKSDAFSFGVVLLGLISKCVPRVKDEHILLYNRMKDKPIMLHKRAPDVYQLRMLDQFDAENVLSFLVHQSMNGDIHYEGHLAGKIGDLALSCVDDDIKERPKMTHVVQKLEDFCSTLSISH
ncbi:protein kinase family protein [Quillaja saponaria]|uniref:Protein kinase family protein n=1 Tax=Quillaja saponaria TaxID=32244 RepID=A0AAD7LXV7_QUISA|nr:protein kinase family protein [Quillaja saponaria]